MIWTANWKGNGNYDAFDMRCPHDGYGCGWYSREHVRHSHKCDGTGDGMFEHFQMEWGRVLLWRPKQEESGEHWLQWPGRYHRNGIY